MHTTKDAEGLRCRHLLVPESPLGCWRGRILHALIVDAAGLKYENRKAGNPGMELKCPRSSDSYLDYVVATISPH